MEPGVTEVYMITYLLGLQLHSKIKEKSKGEYKSLKQCSGMSWKEKSTKFKLVKTTTNIYVSQVFLDFCLLVAKVILLYETYC